MNVLYYAMRYRASGGNLERDFAHEADMRRQAREQLRLDCMDEEESVPCEPTPLDEYEF